MAIRTNFELLDILDGTLDWSISATDLNNNTQVVINTANSLQYMKHKYGTRLYPVLRGGTAPTIEDGILDFNNDFRLWLINRQHNIDKQYQALFDYDYSPIENVDRYENETIVTNNDTTYGKTETDSGTDSVTYGKTNSNDGTDELQRTGSDRTQFTGSETNEIQKAGFNSPNSYTPDTKNTTGYNNREDINLHNTIDTKTVHMTDTLSGTDRTTYGKTKTDGGKDMVDIDTNRTLRVHGNIGVTTNTELIEGDLKLRKISLAEMLLDNFINDYTFYA